MFIGNSSLQTMLSRDQINDAKIMKENPLKLHMQRKISTPHHKKLHCVGHFTMSKITKMLILNVFKSCIMSFVTIIHV